MKIVVCAKEIADPEVASSVFSIDEGTQEVGPGVRYVISPFDAQAIEVALRIKDTVTGAKLDGTKGLDQARLDRARMDTSNDPASAGKL